MRMEAVTPTLMLVEARKRKSRTDIAIRMRMRKRVRVREVRRSSAPRLSSPALSNLRMVKKTRLPGE